MKTFCLKFVFLILPLVLLYVYVCRHLVPLEILGYLIPKSLIIDLLTLTLIFIVMSLVRRDFVKIDAEYKARKSVGKP